MLLFGKDLCRLLKQLASLAVFCPERNDQIILLVQEKPSGIELKEVVGLVTASPGTAAFLSMAQRRRSPPMGPSASVLQWDRDPALVRAGMPAHIFHSLDGQPVAESGSCPAKLSLF